jgi:hypothetical protein
LEAEAIKVAEQGRLDEAIHLLDKACEENPSSSSVYNNRAQVGYVSDLVLAQCRQVIGLGIKVE